MERKQKGKKEKIKKWEQNMLIHYIFIYTETYIENKKESKKA